jgi:hypothetical protein
MRALTRGAAASGLLKRADVRVRTLRPKPMTPILAIPSPPCSALDTLFTELLGAYRCSGGLARGSEVALRAANRRSDGTAWLEDCIERRRLVSLDWHSGLWLPLFQFEPSDMSLRNDVHRTCAELGGVMDGWDLAVWFIRPQWLLQHRSPLQLLDSDPERVFEAARREHFLQGT